MLAPALAGNPRRSKRFLNTLMLRLSLAGRRGLKLERRILAKLMELEYIRPVFFRSLAELQLIENGKPQALQALEAQVKAAGREREETLTEPEEAPETDETRNGEESVADAPHFEAALHSALDAWVGDRWTQEWLGSEPPLADVDLGPYFFIAHDKVGPLAIADVRLTSAATEVVNRLLSPQPVTKALGLKDAAELTSADAVGVFQELAERIRQAETLDSPLQVVLSDFVKIRPELLPQLVALYQGLPEGKILAVTPPLLVEVGRGTSSAPAIRRVLEQWSESTRPSLVAAARSALTRLERPG